MWQAPELEGLVALHARYHTHRFPRHFHDEYVIGVNEGGAHTFYCRGQVHYVPPGAFALLHPGDVHTGEPSGSHEWHYRAFYPSAELLTRLWEEATGRSCTALSFRSSVVIDPPLARALVNASRTSEVSADRMVGPQSIVEVLTLVIARYAEQARGRPVVPANNSVAAKQAREYIDGNAMNRISLAELGAATGVGRFGIIRAFQQEYGIAPYEYVLTVRISHARRLLECGTPAVDVAMTCGFSDQSHLTRHFKRLVGVTPAAYARAVRFV